MPLRICFVADGRSPIARAWIENIVRAGHEAHLVSTYPFRVDDLPVTSVHVIPVAGSAYARAPGAGAASRPTGSFYYRLRGSPLSRALNVARRWVGPLDVIRQAPRLRRLVDGLRPDVVHAMRIPYEGLLAARALRRSQVPLLVSVWGNDFTLHASGAPMLAWLTRKTMHRANAIHPDCHRDLRLARQWGFSPHRMAAVLPGNGGLDTAMFHSGAAAPEFRIRFGIPANVPIVLNPRGVRAYVRHETFFAAIPRVLAHVPEVCFVGLAMAGNESAETWVRRLGVEGCVRLLPHLPREELPDLFRSSAVSVSPSEHDGTPNTLLEAMACGSFPIAGDIESIREWIVPNVNGLLCDPRNPEALAGQIVRALRDGALRQRASKENRRLVALRADSSTVIREAQQLYERMSERFTAAHRS